MNSSYIIDTNSNLNRKVFISIAALSIVTLIGLSLELYLVALIPFGLLLGIIFLLNIKVGYYITAFAIPFSININLKVIHATLNVPSELFLLFLTIVLLYKFFFWKTPKELFTHPLSILIMAYCTLMLISSAFSVQPLISFRIACQTLIYIIPSYFGILYLSKSNPYLPIKILLTSLFSFTIVSFISTLKHARSGFSREMSSGVSIPFYSDHTIYATMAAFMIPLAFAAAYWHFKQKNMRFIIFILSFALCTISIFSSYSRAALISVAISFVLFIIIRFKIRWYYIATAILIAGLIFISMNDDIIMQVKRNRADSKTKKTTIQAQFKSITNVSNDLSNLERINRWNSAIRMIKDRPFLGFGYGMYQFEYFPYQKPSEMTYISIRNPQARYEAGTGGTTHSEFLLLSSENGLLMGIIYVAILFLSIYTVIKDVKKMKRSEYFYYMLIGLGMSITTYAVHSFFNNFLDTSKICFIFFGIIAGICSIDLYLKENSLLNTKNTL